MLQYDDQMSTDVKLGMRERKKIETRRRIEAAALDLFARQGFDGSTVEEIAAAADVAPRTFFHYFSTKEDVALVDYAKRLDRLLGALAARPRGEKAWESLRQAFREVAGEDGESRVELLDRLRLMVETPSVFARSLELQAGWESGLSAALAERSGAEPTDLESTLLAAAALAAMRASIRHWLTGATGRDLPSCLDDCFERLGSGLSQSNLA